MENFAKKILCRQAIFLVVLVFLVSLCTFGQNVTVKGKIVDTDKNPLIGVTVIQKGTTNGTVTNYDGDYSISVPSAATLVFSFIGLESQEQAVAGRSTIDIQMKSASIGVDEVVVVGFGTQKKVNLTGAVETVGSEVLESRPVQNAVQMLQGVVAGLNISTQGLGVRLMRAVASTCAVQVPFPEARRVAPWC